MAQQQCEHDLKLRNEIERYRHENEMEEKRERKLSDNPVDIDEIQVSSRCAFVLKVILCVTVFSTYQIFPSFHSCPKRFLF